MKNRSNPNNEMSECELLAQIVIFMREQKMWTQETLAEISKVNIRTIQRLENAEPTTVDTRRALARAFEYEDIDVFNSDTFIHDFLKWGEEVKRFTEDTIEKSLENICSGRKIRELIETNEAFAFHQLHNLSAEAEEVMAEFQDYVKDYSFIHDVYSAVEKLDINEEFQKLLNKLACMELTMGFFIRRLCKKHADSEPLCLNTVYFVVGFKANFPKIIRVQKKVTMGF